MKNFSNLYRNRHFKGFSEQKIYNVQNEKEAVAKTEMVVEIFVWTILLLVLLLF